MGGMTRLLLLLWAGVTVGSLVDLQKRIIGGHDCAYDEHPYHVSLRFNDGSSFFPCSGTLISDWWILTAAHCNKPKLTITAVFGRYPMSTNRVTVITWDIEDKRRFFPNTTDDQGTITTHDIMLLKLQKPTLTIPVRLPDCKKKPKRGDELKIAGYKSTARPGQNKTVFHNIVTSKPLQCANTTYEECHLARCVKREFQYPHVFCYQDQDKYVDTTPGDSGGGVVVKDTIYGVHVRGNDIACYGRSVSIDICADIYKKWIKDTTLILWP